VRKPESGVRVLSHPCFAAQLSGDLGDLSDTERTLVGLQLRPG